MVIDCGTCAAAPAACNDCIVSVLLGLPEGLTPAAEVEVADEHTAALTVLADSGLVPPLRLVPKSAAS